MKLKLFRHLWGLDEPWETAFPKIKAAGYAGIESGLPEPGDETRFRELLAAHQFDYIAQIFTTGGDVRAHLASFRDQSVRAATFEPVLVNCHGGRDAWTTGESQQFYDAVLAVERDQHRHVGFLTRSEKMTDALGEGCRGRLKRGEDAGHADTQSRVGGGGEGALDVIEETA